MDILLDYLINRLNAAEANLADIHKSLAAVREYRASPKLGTSAAARAKHARTQHKLFIESLQELNCFFEALEAITSVEALKKEQEQA